MAATKRTAKDTWDAIVRQAEEDEIDRFLAKSPAEVDASLRAHGLDPAAIRAEGAALGFLNRETGEASEGELLEEIAAPEPEGK